VSTRDTQRAKVYAAEQFVRTMFDRAAEHGSQVVDFFGTPLTLPPEGRFASVESIQRYVDMVLDHPEVQRYWPHLTPITVRARRGVTAAHYEQRGQHAVIAVPDSHDRWALRELVVLHEIAHHLSEAQPPHGPEFVAAFRTLAGIVMGPEVEHVLRVVHFKEGVRG
jgi:putative metallohydrolase (TIGR04338 family)